MGLGQSVSQVSLLLNVVHKKTVELILANFYQEIKAMAENQYAALQWLMPDISSAVRTRQVRVECVVQCVAACVAVCCSVAVL